MLRAPARLLHSGGVLRSRRSRRTTTATTPMARERREYPAGKPCRSIHSNPIRGGSTRFMAMCGNGRKTVGTTTTLERPRMARLGHPAGVGTASFAAVPGTSIRGSSARPSASGTPPTAWTTSLGSVSGGRLPLDRLERVEARLEKVETRLTSIESDLPAVRHNLDDLREKVENV